jgi:integrase
VASKPYPDLKRGIWYCKYKPDPTGKWVRVVLGKDPRLKGARPPKTPPQPVIDRHHGFTEVEFKAKHGIALPKARPKGLEAYAGDYLAAFAASHKAGSVKQARRHARNFVAFAASRGVVAVQAVDRALCREYLESRVPEVSHDTLRTEMRYLMPLWQRAVDDGLMAANPWSRLKVPGKSTRSAPVFWSREELDRIAAGCLKGWQSDLVQILAHTGLRISTALAMRWDWVDWDSSIIRIPAGAAAETEGVKTAYAPYFDAAARDTLQRRHAVSRSDLAFPNPYKGGGEISYDTARAGISKGIKRAGVKPGTPHDIRHSYLRLLERAGVPWSIVQRQGGHSSITTTQRYADADADEAAKWLERLEANPPAPPPDPSPPRP